MDLIYEIMNGKGERYIGCSDEYWFVASLADNHVIGKFSKKGDALLDAAAPKLYEALKLTHSFMIALKDQYPDIFKDYRVIMLDTNIEQALAEVDSK